MKLSRNPLIVFGAYILVFWVLLWAGSSGDLVLRAAIWAILGTMSAVAIFKTLQRGGGRRGTHGQDAAMPDRARRWVFDEPDPKVDQGSGGA